MTRRYFTSVSVIVLGAAALLASPASAENFAARARVDQAAQACRASGGQAQRGPGVLRETRIGSTAATVVDMAQLSCKGGPLPACGPFGCQVLVFLGARSDAVFEGQVKAWRVRGAEFQVTRAGAYCANSATGACSETHKLADGRFTLAGRGTASFARDPYRAAPSENEAGAPARRSAAARARNPAAEVEPPPEAEPEIRTAPPSAQNPEERRRQLQNAPYVR